MNRIQEAAMAVTLLASLGANAVGTAQERDTTVAVLDFINRQPGDGFDWLAKGLADMVITDLSASRRLTVVDRERMQQLASEFDLAAAGILDASTVPAVGRIAKAQWVLQGTFSCQRGKVVIEALLIDVTTQQALRIEQMEGPLDNVFEMESRLIRRILENLKAPMTQAELRRVTLLKTQSLPAFEHYSRSLRQFDAGEWYAALQSARLARRSDPGYLLAAARVAWLYQEVNEPEHALIEYRRLVEQDEQNALPEIVYFRMAVTLDEALADRDSAAGILQRILARYRDDLPPFDVTVPSRLSHAWDDVGGTAGANEIAARNETRLRTLARLANWQEEAGDHFQAAQFRSQMRHFLYTHGMPFGHTSLHFGASILGPSHTEDGYWNIVRENRDRSLYPGTVNVISDSETTDAKTGPTHGYYKWQDASRYWLAPPDHEIASVSYRIDVSQPDQSPDSKDAGNRDSDQPANTSRPVQFDFRSPEVGFRQLFEHFRVERDGKWHELKLDKGVRALRTYVHHDKRWQMRFELRPWTKPADLPPLGSFQVNVLPGGADVIRNGELYGPVQTGVAFVRIPTGEYTVEARWPDGRRRSTVVQIEQGRRIQFCLNADVETVSRKVVAPQGSNTCLLNDRSGRFWLVWDEHQESRLVTHNKESSIYCATSPDGAQWSRRRRLPVSSLSADYVPILRQDRRGVYWLVWISERGPQSEKNVWIASSSNGVEWSFPRKVALPKAVGHKLAGWRERPSSYIAFTIDTRNVFWMVWHGWLLRSDDAVTWQVDRELQTGSGTPDHHNIVKYYHLSCDADGQLVLLANAHGGYSGAELWRRDAAGDWKSLNRLTDKHTRDIGSAASRPDGSILAITPHGSNLHVHEFDRTGKSLEPLAVETYLTLPFHPSILPMSANRWLVSFGSREGIVAAVLQKDLTADLSEDQ